MTTDTILLVGHGSREPSGNEEILAFAAQWRQRQPGWKIEVCFIELAEVTLAEGLRRAASAARRVIVVPLILNAAGHVKGDIPRAIDAARLNFPRVQFLYAPPLSVCEPLFSVLKRRLQSAMQALDMPDPRTTGVVLLGRGSSDRHANGEMAKMARWLLEETEHELVDLAFTGITHPRLENVVQRQTRLGMTQVAVLPYYLFKGVLIERIERQVANLRQQYPTTRFALTRYFGFEPEIFEVLTQRVEDAQRAAPAALMPCDGCQFRVLALAHGQEGHHHPGGCAAHGHDHPQHAHPHGSAQHHPVSHPGVPS